jgi:hypothetical protein
LHFYEFTIVEILLYFFCSKLVYENLFNIPFHFS